MAQGSGRYRTHYPLRAYLAVGGAGSLLAFNGIVGFLFMALVPPFIPVYIGILFAGASLVETALRYARRVSNRQPVTMLRSGKHEEEDAPSAVTARAA